MAWVSGGRGLVLECEDGVHAMAANVTKRLWEIGDIVGVLESWEIATQRAA